MPTDLDRVRSWVPLAGWLASLGAGIVLFTALGSGPLEAPPLGQPSAWGAWAAARDPLVAAVAVLRLIVLALTWYLVGVTTVGLIARLTRAARLVRVADALSLPVVRRVLQSAAGLTLAASVVASASGAAPAAASRSAAAPAPVTVTAVALTDDVEGAGAARTVAVVVDGAASPATASMAALDARTTRMVGLGPPGAAADQPAVGDASIEDAMVEDAIVEDASPALDAEPSEHEVVAGDHLWSIAASHLEAHLGRTATDAEVAGHWQRLIDANRDRLSNPNDPDLILPGQRFVLPDLPEGAGA